MPRGPEYSQDTYVTDSHLLPSEEPLQFLEQDFHERKKNKKSHGNPTQPSIGSSTHSLSHSRTSFTDTLHDIYGNSGEQQKVDPSQIFTREPVSRSEMYFQNGFRPTTMLAGKEYYTPTRAELDD